MHPAFTVLAGILAMALLVYSLVRLSRARRTENLLCPETGLECEVQFDCKTDALGGPGEAVDVTRCSALSKPEDVTCDKACMPSALA